MYNSYKGVISIQEVKSSVYLYHAQKQEEERKCSKRRDHDDRQDLVSQLDCRPSHWLISILFASFAGPTHIHSYRDELDEGGGGLVDRDGEVGPAVTRRRYWSAIVVFGVLMMMRGCWSVIK